MTLEEIRAKFAADATYKSLGLLAKELELLIERDGNSADHAMLLGQIYQARGEWLKAASIYAHYSEVFPDHVDFTYQAALTFVDAGLYEKGHSYLNKLTCCLERLSDHHLRGIWRAASLLADHELAFQAHALVADRGSPHANSVVERRIQMARHERPSNMPMVVSIGENCLPWMLANRWGFRRDIFALRHQSFFNLAQTKSFAVADLINDGVSALTDAASLSSYELPTGTPCPANEKYKFFFNHEQGDRWIANSFEKLRGLYEHRIAAFDAALKEPRCIFFHYTKSGSRAGDVLRSIQSRRSTRDYRIVLISISDVPIDLRGVDVTTVLIRHMQLPRPDYVWFKPDDYESPEGFEFEKQISDLLSEAVAALEPGTKHEKTAAAGAGRFERVYA
ncbi:tetratricopeptide repeat protein [Methylobacterium sp. D54C]